MRFPLKVKVGLYSALVCVLALLAMQWAIRGVLYARQLEQLDEELHKNAEDLFRMLDAREDRGVDRKRQLLRENIPTSLRLRRLRIWTDDGTEIYRSANWERFDPETLNPGALTVLIENTNSRFITKGQNGYHITIGTRLLTLEKTQDTLSQVFFYITPVVGLIVLAGVFLIARHSLQPISAMTAAAGRITVARPTERLPVPKQRDEIECLSRVLNDSFDRLEKAYQAAESFSGSASHQLKTPLSILRAGLSDLRSCEYLQDSERDTVESLIGQTRRLDSLCEDLLLLAQVDAGRLDLEPEVLDVVPLVRGMIDDLEVMGMDMNIAVEHDIPVEAYTIADRRRVAVILQNLADNAVKYNFRNGRIRVSIKTDGGKLIVSVANTGISIAPGDAEHIFERFKRGNTVENVKGHGLGLSIARGLARAQEGELRLARSDRDWTEFELVLPAVKREK